jgi:hypothetical protein
MLLKGGTPDHEGDDLPDRWEVGPQLAAVAQRWAIDPDRDLRRSPAPV